MGYEDIKSALSKIMLDKGIKDNLDEIIEVKEEIISCEKDHPKVYINIPIGKVVRCQYCNTAYKRIE
tara:strand:- start:65 stop:265 length:201 start_codon:yes stop_codon:yes gene_type:complete